MTSCCPIVELRQYTLVPGGREVLIELFERELIESQEEVGMRVIGTFRDQEKPDRFVWLRGFRDMESRAVQLQQFYGGPVWKRNRDAANTTMIDSDNVLLLRTVTAQSGFMLGDNARPPVGAAELAAGMIVATIYHLKGTGDEFAEFFGNSIVPILSAAGVTVSASFITEHHPNTFPALPVREDANVFVWFTRVAAAAGKLQHPAEIQTMIADRIKGEAEVLLLSPTARSLLR